MHHAFNGRLRRLLWGRRALSLMVKREGTWLAGQCWILAEALLRWITLSRVLPSDAVFLIVVGDRHCPAHHVLVCVVLQGKAGQERRWYVDANGANTEGPLLRYWREKEGLDEPFLGEFDEQFLLGWAIPRDGRTSTDLAQLFFEELGPFSPAMLDESRQ
jgi:hypothetical protein